MLSDNECQTFHKNKNSIHSFPKDSLEETKQLKGITITAKKHKSFWKETIRSLVHYSFIEEAEYYADHGYISLNGEILSSTFLEQLFIRYFYPARITRWMITKQYDGDNKLPKGEIYDGIHVIPHHIKEIVVRTDRQTCMYYDFSRIGLQKNITGSKNGFLEFGKASIGIKINDGYDYESLQRNLSTGNPSSGTHLSYLVCFIPYSQEELKGIKKQPHQTQLSPTSRITAIRGFTRPETFYSPIHKASSKDLKQDFRRTLYWNPSVKTDAQGIARVTFHNNNSCRSLHISAEGIGADGNPIIYYNKEKQK